MDEKLDNKIKEIMEEIMGINLSTLAGSTMINTISEWDSFNNLMLISKIQEEFKIEFTAVEIEEMKTIDSIFKQIKAKVLK